MGFEKWEEMGFENLTLLGFGAGFPEGPSRGAVKRPASAFAAGGASVGSGATGVSGQTRSAPREVTSSSSPDRGAGFFSPGPDAVPAPGPRAGGAGSCFPGCHDVAVVEEPIQERRGHHLVPEDRPPLLEPLVRARHRGRSLVALIDELEEQGRPDRRTDRQLRLPHPRRARNTTISFRWRKSWSWS